MHVRKLFLFLALVAGFSVGATEAQGASVIIQDLGPALNPEDPTNGGFWSLDWVDDRQVRHVHAGVTVCQVEGVHLGLFESSDLVVSLESNAVPLRFGGPGFLLFLR